MGDRKNIADEQSGFSRRGVLKGALAGALAPSLLGAGTAEAGSEVKSPPDHDDIVDLTRQVPFYGNEGQAGVATPPQRYMMFMTFDVNSKQPEDLQVLLARWSAAIAQMMAGKAIGAVEPMKNSAVGMDTGEALNLGPASLTITVGLGPRIFSDQLVHKRPPLMRELKTLPSDAFLDDYTGGDLSVQACADDPQVCYHAIRNLARIAKQLGTAHSRWSQLGFGRASAGKGQHTPRNLFGFKDGTRNLTEPAQFDQFVWTHDNGPEWQQWGTYQVVRKIMMRIENWDTDRVSDQNQVFGRTKVTGAPLSGTHEFDQPDFNKRDANGELVIPVTSHISLVAHENNNGVRILRRSYNYNDGLDKYGMFNAGLIMFAYQNNPAHFELLQTRLGESDQLNEYISHIGSGIFYIPRAPREGSYIGQELFA